jgi:RHS repeat-associated protein
MPAAAVSQSLTRTGRRTKVCGDVDADFGYTGHFFHAPSALHLAPRRAYDAAVGRWISKDPINSQGPNLYAYARNNPLRFFDPLGLATVSFTVRTVIRSSSSASPGMKSSHIVFVDTDSGVIRWQMKVLGDTTLPSALPLAGGQTAGSGSLTASSSGGKGCITVKFDGWADSFWVPADIDYHLTITWNQNKGKGHLSGTHDGYPSYEVYKDTTKIYDYQEGWMAELATANDGDVRVDKDFP